MLRLEAYERFRAKLASGEVRPGSFLTQKEIAELAGVQIGPAREAILALAHENLLRIHAKRGVQVVEATLPLIRNAYEVRLMTELFAVERFAASAPIDLIDALAEETADILGRARQGVDRRLEAEGVEVDWGMHDRMVEHLGNPIIEESFKVNQTRIRLIRQDNRFDPDRLVSVMHEHWDILEACRARDGERAAALMRAHIATSRRRAIDNSGGF